MDRLKLATVWLGGCSGCHMSFLDLDEWLFDLAAQADIVFSPFMDKTSPKPVAYIRQGFTPLTKRVPTG